MSWTELIDAVAAEAGVGREPTRRVLTALVRVSVQWLADGREVPLRGLGGLRARWTGARVVRSVADQRKMFVGGRFVARFKASAALKDALAARTDDTWRSPEHQAAWRLAETLIGDLDLYHGADAPSGLEASLAPDQVEAACAASFGPAWSQVAQTYRERVPAALIAESSYLGIAARRRWSQA